MAASGAYGPSYSALYGTTFPQVYEPTAYGTAAASVGATPYAAYGGGFGAAAATYAAGFPAYEYGTYGAASREVRYPGMNSNHASVAKEALHT